MSSTPRPNTYLEQVVAQQEELEQEMRPKAQRASAPAAPAAAGLAVEDAYGAPAQAPARRSRGRAQAAYPAGSPLTAAGGRDDGRAAGTGRAATGAGRPATGAVDVRITGFGRWKTVLVPPNAFVVHTRRGRKDPLHLGLGVSFRYRPATDSFLVVPGAMQTIMINAYCICRELQGLVVQAYVQWLIQDFATAYRKLDFSDLDDPMRLVNLQLKEQAEAAIKDKVATMSVHEVLSDKQPIIQELTARLRAVAEGEGEAHEGLGLRIVTVQIKEAVVSSARLWENLQQPYRAEQDRLARLAALAAETAVAQRERIAGREGEIQRIENERELAELRARNDAQSFDRDAAEQARRTQREQEDVRQLAELQHHTTAHALDLERALHAQEIEIGRLRIEREQELKRLEQDGELVLVLARAQASHERALLELKRDRMRAAIDNEQSPASIQAKLVGSLPEIVERMPKPAELTSVMIGGNDATSVSGLLAELGAVVGALRHALSPTERPG